MSGLVIRRGTADDLGTAADIYDHYVRETAATFDLDVRSAAQRRRWWSGFSERGRHQVFVAARGARVLGYACSHPYRPKGAYDATVETTIYLEPAATGAGVGRRLYAALLDALAAEDVHRALAGVALPNPASLALHERLGFEPVGVFREVGFKLGRYWDVKWLARAMR